MPLADGEVFAGYTIRRVLGSGGMGEVYLAEHPRLPRWEALKVLGVAVSADEEYRARFGLEAEMVATLRHPNIVTIHDRGSEDGRLWIAMDYVEGIDAARLLAERHPGGVPPREVVRIVGAVAAALDYAHGRGVLHRDIKPGNILLGQDDGDHGRILLADFGVARWIGRPNHLTGIDMTVGTVTYAAPEQLRGEDVDGRADQYSLAATAYHLLTGRAPFAQSNPAVVITHHLSSPPPSLESAGPDLRRLGPVLARAMAKDPADRFDSCGLFAAALSGALDGGGRRPPGRGRRRAAAGLGALMLAGAAAAAVLLGSERAEAPSAGRNPPPPAVSARMDLPVVVIGADCAVLGAAAVTENGAPAYCARSGPDPSPIEWSAQPERLRAANR
jgi:serine/threonine protein kinase, bacterial